MTHCYVCNSPLQLKREDRELVMGSRSVVVEHELFCCSNCGEEYLLPEQMSAIQERASNRIREDEGLLQPVDIRRIRAGLGLTQNEFERLLGVGSKTVVRWERGSVFQSRSADNLMRLAGEVPAAAGYLARRNGIEVTQSSSTGASEGELTTFMNVVAVAPFLNFGPSGPWHAAEILMHLKAATVTNPKRDEREQRTWITSGDATVHMTLGGPDVVRRA